MKLISINFATLITLTIVLQAMVVSADIMARVVFTNGGSCDSSERAKVEAIFGDGAVQNRRILLRESRDLSSYSSYCRSNCEGYRAGSCFAIGCRGWRGRELGHNEEVNLGQNNGRELQTCDEVINSIHLKLDNLKSEVTNSCKTYLGDRNSRQTACYNDVVYGAVNGAKIWKISSSGQTVLIDSLPAGGYSFCKSTSFNIESLNDPCVDNAVLDLKGPNGYHRNHEEVNAPYSLFGDSGTTFHGTTLSAAGLYTLTITPDGFDSKKKTFTFTLNNC